MKRKLLLILFVATLLGACTQRICPTYADKGVPEVEEKMK